MTLIDGRDDDYAAFRLYALGGDPETYMQRKMFWLVLITLGLIADFILPLIWGLLATIPLVVLSWWIAYRSGWFE